MTEIGTRFHSIENHRLLMSALVRQRDNKHDNRIDIAHIGSSGSFLQLEPPWRAVSTAPTRRRTRSDVRWAPNTGANGTRLDELDGRDELVHDADPLVPRLEQLLGDLNRN